MDSKWGGVRYLLNKFVFFWDFWAFRGPDIFFRCWGLKFKNGYWDTHYAKNGKIGPVFLFSKEWGCLQNKLVLFLWLLGFQRLKLQFEVLKHLSIPFQYKQMENSDLWGLKWHTSLRYYWLEFTTEENIRDERKPVPQKVKIQVE